MAAPIQHPHETRSNLDRQKALQYEPLSLRTYTPTQAVLAHSAGIYHWTPEGRRLYDFTSGVLVANLGHNPISWMDRFCHYMHWPSDYRNIPAQVNGFASSAVPPGFFPGLAMTAYNGVTPLEVQASERLVEVLQKSRGGKHLEQVMWAASGSEAVQKALWAGMACDKSRNMILATRFGFHGKKGLAGAVTGSEHDYERDPRVRFFGFPMKECADVSLREQDFDPTPYRKELESLLHQYGRRFGTLITEPYLGGGGSFHPHPAYLKMIQDFCRENDIVFILDEVQANFGRTGSLFAFETYGVEPDIVVLGKGLGNGVPVAAAVGRKDIFDHLGYGEGSDTWSANPLCCASVLATLDEFASGEVMANCHRSSAIIEAGLVTLKELPFVAHVRGEKGGMVWGIEMKDWADKTGPEWANAAILNAYLGDGPNGDGIHLLGALAKKIIRVSPPLVITEAEATTAMGLFQRSLQRLLQPQGSTTLAGVC